MNDIARGSCEGSQFGRYQLKRLLGGGGMGTVWEAQDTSNQQMVALKVWPLVFSCDLVFCSRLQRQARIVGRLDEPHIVPINDCGEIGGQQFVAMRLIEGTDLSQLLKQLGALTAPRAIAIVRHTASGLDAAHAVGIVHGDLKPENILLGPDDFAYLVDFGISDASPRKGVARVIGSAVGTWKYTAPERFTAPAVDHRVDIYALTCVLYECLTGSPPFWADSAGALINAHLVEPIPRPSELNPAIPSALDEVIACGMAKDPSKRYASAGDLAFAAHTALGTPDEDRTSETTKRPAARVPGIKLEMLSAAEAPSGVSVPMVQPSPEAHYEHGVRHLPPTPTPALRPESTRGSPPLPGFDLDGSSWLGGGFGAGSLLPGLPWATSGKPRRRLVQGVAVAVVLVLSTVAIWLLRPSYFRPSASDANNISSSSAATPASAAAQAHLFGLVPRDYPAGACRPITPPKVALSEVSCDQSSDAVGPLSATYALFADANSLGGAFNRIVEASNIIECPGRIQSPGPWHRNATPDKTSGMLLCGIQNGSPLVAWTNDPELLISVANGGPQGPAIDQLYEWWASHS